METSATDAHFERFKAGHAETAKASTMHPDALRDLKTVNANLAAAAHTGKERRTAADAVTRGHLILGL